MRTAATRAIKYRIEARDIDNDCLISCLAKIEVSINSSEMRLLGLI